MTKNYAYFWGCDGFVKKSSIKMQGGQVRFTYINAYKSKWIMGSGQRGHWCRLVATPPSVCPKVV